MKYFAKELQTGDMLSRTAGVKARDDADAILSANGWQEILFTFDSEDQGKKNLFHSLHYHQQTAQIWKQQLAHLQAGDILLMQFPVKNHSLLLFSVIQNALRKGVKILLLIHDLEIIRATLKDDMPFMKGIRLSLEEKSILHSCTGMIVHNNAMKKKLCEMGYAPEKMITLGIFDYLIPDYDQKSTSIQTGKNLPVIIAGNLRKHKAGYVYDLPENCHFNLYGIGYEAPEKEHISYFGSYPPDELPFALNGSFGLVWDGDSAKTCAGVYGQYLKINNPHKTSLYLASGIPVIVWKHSAMANLIQEHDLGLTVESLDEIADQISALSPEAYQHMLNQVQTLAIKLRNGAFLKRAAEQLSNRKEI